MSQPTRYEYNYLLVYVRGNNELKELYREKKDEHNNKIINNRFPNAGFDLFCQKKKRRYIIDLQIKCALYKNIKCDGGPVKRYQVITCVLDPVLVKHQFILLKVLELLILDIVVIYVLPLIILKIMKLMLLKNIKDIFKFVHLHYAH